jgi:hypothetical protein
MMNNDTFRSITAVEIAANRPPMLLVVVDTEEEFDWTKPFSRTNVSTETLVCQHAAQDILSRYCLTPTYVIDYPVAASPAMRVLRELKDSGRCQIGTHQHPWLSPPYEEEVVVFNSYPGNLPPDLERRKLERLTIAVERASGDAPTVYKAGRYGIGPATAAILTELGYKIDISLVPHTDFRADGGPNFCGLGDRPFWFGPDSGLLEIPLTRGFTGRARRTGPLLYPILLGNPLRHAHAAGLARRLGLLQRVGLSPEGFSVDQQCRLLRTMYAAGHRVFMLTYHSPSLVPGHTPYVRSAEDLEHFLETLDFVIRFFMEVLSGVPATPFDILEIARESKCT